MAWVSASKCNGVWSLDGAAVQRAHAGYGTGDSGGWTQGNDGLTIESDRLGLLPLYYYETGDRFVCANSITDLFRLGIPCHVDRVLLVLTEDVCHCPAEFTIFEGIKRVPASTVVRIGSPHGVTFKTHHKIPTPNGLRLGEAVEAYGEIFEQSVKRLVQLEDHVVVPLSGGRDSRHILLACKAIGIDVEAVTFDNYPPTGVDVDVAAELSRRTGFPHRVLPNPEYTFHASLVRTLPEINFESLRHGWIWALIDALAQDPRPFLDGLAGDGLSNAKSLYFKIEENRQMRERKSKRVADDISTAVLNTRAGKRLTPTEVERLRHIVEWEQARWSDWPNPQVAHSLLGRVRRGTAIAPLTISRLSGAPLLLPYLESEMFEFLIGLDEQHLELPDFHDRVIMNRYREYADIPYGTYRSSARMGILPSLRNVLPYVRPTPRVRGLKLDSNLKWIAILRVFMGDEFPEQEWRLREHDLSVALHRTLQDAGVSAELR